MTVTGMAERSIFTEKRCGYLLLALRHMAGQVYEGLKLFIAWPGLLRESDRVIRARSCRTSQILCKRVQFISAQEFRLL